MGKIATTLDEPARAWIAEQHMFFVASAPLSGNRHVNCSPKGLDSFRVLDNTRVAYLDFVGSGAETIAHVRENGRVCLLFCAFEGAPKIVRLHGRASVVEPGEREWAALLALFEPLPDAPVRSVIQVELERVASSCGYGVPRFEYVGERDQLNAWGRKKNPQAVRQYQLDNNSASIDGLPALKWTAAKPDAG